VVVDRLAQAVREQLGLGRLLPLGGADDGAWLTERAATAVFRRAADGVPGVRLGAMRVGPAGAGSARGEAEPASGGRWPASAAGTPGTTGTAGIPRAASVLPPTALPPGPLRIEAEFAGLVDQPLPASAGLLRRTLLNAAEDRLGLRVEAVNLRVTSLFGIDDSDADAAGFTTPWADPGESAPAEDAASDVPAGVVAARAAASAVPGVARPAPVLGGRRHAVRIEDRPAGRHALVQIAVAAGHRALDVAREVRTAVARTVSGPVTVAVLVTWVECGDR
jgi:hypothetical protein